MKYCGQCGNPLKDGVSYCGKCGKQIRNPEVKIQPVKLPSLQPDQSKPERKAGKGGKKRIPVFLLVFALLAVSAGGTLGWLLLENKGKEKEIYYKEIDPEHVKSEEAVAYIDNEILLTAADGIQKSKIEKLVREYDGRITGFIEVTGDYQIEFETAHNLEELQTIADALAGHPEIERTSINYAEEVDNTAMPEGYYTGEIWDNNPDARWAWEATHAVEAWEYLNNPEAAAVNVGVLEGAAFYQDHKDIKNTYADSSFNNNPDNSHGSAVASVIAADSTDEDGMCGIYPWGREKDGTKHMYFGTMKLKYVFPDHKHLASLMTYKAEIARLAMYDCKVINMSFAESAFMAYIDPQKCGSMLYYRKTEAREMAEFLRKLFNVKDFLLVQSAGNESNQYYVPVRVEKDDHGIITAYYDIQDPYYFSTFYDDISITIDGVSYPVTGAVQSSLVYLKKLPIEYTSLFGGIRLLGNEYKDVLDHIIITGAIEKDFETGAYKTADYSNEGELYMPGSDILCAENTGKDGNTDDFYGVWSGTSFAAPIMTGAAAMVWTQNQYLKAADVKRILRDSQIQYDDIFMVDIEEAVKKGSMHAQVPDDTGKGTGMLGGVIEAYEDEIEAFLEIKNLDTGETAEYHIFGNTEFYLPLEPGDYELISARGPENQYGKLVFENETFHLDENGTVFIDIPLYKKFTGKITRHEISESSFNNETIKNYDLTIISEMRDGLLIKENYDGYIAGAGGYMPPYYYEYSYDDSGLLSERRQYLPDGENIETATYEYDEHNNPLRIHYYSLSPVPPFDWYDSNDIYQYTYNPDGTIAVKTSSHGTDDAEITEYPYDKSGSLISETTRIDDFAVSGQTYPGFSWTTDYTYDDNGLLSSSSKKGDHQPTTQYEYGRFGTVWLTVKETTTVTTEYSVSTNVLSYKYFIEH